MSDARTLSRTDYTFRARGYFALSQDEAWDRMTQQWPVSYTHLTLPTKLL